MWVILVIFGVLLDSEFEDNIGNFPPINTQIEIESGTKFRSMNIAVYFIEQYALQNSFAIFKHKSEKFMDGTDRKRVFKCDMGGRYVKRGLRLLLIEVSRKNFKFTSNFTSHPIG